MKKTLAIILFAGIIIGMTACDSNSSSSSSAATTTTTTTTQTEQTTTTTTETTTVKLPETTTEEQTTTEETTTTKPKETTSDAIITYRDMIHLNITTLAIRTTDDRNYNYNGIPLLSDDMSQLRIGGKADPGALYRKMAMLLDGFEIGNAWGKYAKNLIGYIPDTRDEFYPYVQNAKTFITTKDALTIIMTKLQSLKSTDGLFDIPNKKYDFKITSLKECAKELQISEECLGYILGELAEYGVSLEETGVDSVAITRSI